MKIVVGISLMLLAAFCLFGYAASTEPGPNHVYFRIGYPLVAMLCAVASWLLFQSAKRAK